MPIEITVAICTYNRADLLFNAIESLCQQSLPASSFEIIVVDNGSTDNTAEFVRDCQVKHPDYTIRSLTEGQRGLSSARNRAMQEAHGNYIAYLDDDARVSSEWLAQVMAAIGEERARPLHCLGGPIQPFYTSSKPGWFRDVYESRSWGDEERLLRASESFSGSNMIWHRIDLLALGGFDERVGVTGQILSLGEETSVFVKAWQEIENPIMRYNPALTVEHLVPAFKMKVSYRLKRAFVAGQVAVIQRTNPRGRVHDFLGACKGILVGGLKALWRCRRYPHWQNWTIEEGQPIMINLGTILAVLGIYVTVRQE
jgi:glycosyltransferase involved in cell wall biosynthesis